MNMFKSLDSIFPCGDANRPSGEVVGVSIRIFLGNVDLGEIYMKRKAWYVNASVNAFHMHRSLVRDFVDLVHDHDLTASRIKRSKRLISLAVLNSYLANQETGEQVYAYNLHIGSLDGVSMYWNAYSRVGDWREITDSGDRILMDLVNEAVKYHQVGTKR